MREILKLVLEVENCCERLYSQN